LIKSAAKVLKGISLMAMKFLNFHDQFVVYLTSS